MKEKAPEKTPRMLIAENIAALSRVNTALAGNALNQRAVIILLHAVTKVSMKNIKTILDALPKLEKEFMKP